jgi:hypothetical protein
MSSFRRARRGCVVSDYKHACYLAYTWTQQTGRPYIVRAVRDRWIVISQRDELRFLARRQFAERLRRNERRTSLG